MQAGREDRDDVGVLVIARDNFFTFWPMVPGIVSSDIDARNVAQPLRRALILAGASFRRAKVNGVDPNKKVVEADGGIEFPYDQLIISLGGQPNFFGIPGVEEHSMTMRGVEDAERVRNRVIERFEEVSLIRDEVPESKLTFVVIGGGATGVEVASEIHTLVHENLAPDYPNIDPYRVRIYLIEALPNILPELDPALRRAARTRLLNERIEVLTGAMAEEITGDCVKLEGRQADRYGERDLDRGQPPEPDHTGPRVAHDERTGIKVDLSLRVEGNSDVWAIGDCAAVQDVRQERARSSRRPRRPRSRRATWSPVTCSSPSTVRAIWREFEYKPLGQLVELGSDFAVNEVMGVRFTGMIAAIFWRMAYLVRLNSPQSKVRVAADWIFGLFLRPAVTQIRGTSEE